MKKGKTDDDEIDLGNLARSTDASPAVKLTNVLLIDCTETQGLCPCRRASSSVLRRGSRVRLRIDGVLYNVMTPADGDA